MRDIVEINTEGGWVERAQEGFREGGRELCETTFHPLVVDLSEDIRMQNIRRQKNQEELTLNRVSYMLFVLFQMFLLYLNNCSDKYIIKYTLIPTTILYTCRSCENLP